MKMDMKQLFFLLLPLVLCFSCKMDDAEYLSPDELAVSQKEFYVDTNTGRFSFTVYANKKGVVSVLSGGEWLHPDRTAFEGDATVSVEYLYNEGLPRKGMVLLETDSRRDTVSIMQEGMKREAFDFPQTSVLVYNGMGDTVVPADCNVPLSEVKMSVQYQDGHDWIRSLSLETDKLVLATQDNPDPKARRTAFVSLSHTDRWDRPQSFLIRITQTPSDNRVGDEVSFEQLRALFDEPGTHIIDDDYCITGYVVSRPESGNTGENEVLAINYIDYDADYQTAYIESEDAKYGFRIRTSTTDDNIFKADTRVRLLLSGASIRKEVEPDRFMLEDVTAAMVLESVAADIPAKPLRIGELKDSDLYTYVTLQDCEIPVRKGCLTPVNEGYTRLFRSNRVSKFPILVRDIQGSSLYMYTNTTCPYRRTGAKLPYGKGRISGIIVHEKYRSFIDKDNPDEALCGNIGRYQIRHTRYADLALEEDIEGSFSALLTEYRYMNPSPDPNVKAFVPTYGSNGTFTHTDYDQCYKHNEYAYLGPCGDEYKGQTINGYGIILPNGESYGKGDKGNADGKGESQWGTGLCWRTNKWWDNSTNRPKAWLISFSTAGIVTDHISMQLSTQNISQDLQDPRYWAAEWSFQSDMSEAADDQWHLIANYVVPDIGIDANTLVNQSLGFKQMDFPLPLEILDHDQVYIRLRPTSKAAGSGYDYDESELKASGNGNAISYFAIRYNK